MIGKTISFGSKLVLGNGTDFMLEKIARKKDARTYEEGLQYVNEMLEKYQKKFEQIDDDTVITIETVGSKGKNAKINPWIFEYYSSKPIYEKKNGKNKLYIPFLNFTDKIKHKSDDPDYVRGFQKGVEYPSVEHVLRKAYELALDVKNSENLIFIPPLPTLFK